MDLDHPDLELGRFVARDNRFVCRVRRDNGEVVRAHLANTARLLDLLVEDARVVLRPSHDPQRTTAWSLTRVRHAGTWVALEAAGVATLIADELATGHAQADWPRTRAVQREVRVGQHRIDLALDLSDGSRAFVEVKSLSRAIDGRAPLSWTPSTRGVAQLGLLAELARQGHRTAVAFVVQRSDVEVLALDAHADPSWVEAVRAARRDGVRLLAYGCTVTPTTLHLGARLRVEDAADSALLAEPYGTTLIELEAPERAPVIIAPDPTGATPGALPDLVPAGTQRLHIITACNPRSRRLTDEDNADRNRSLLAAARDAGIEVIRADGSAPDGSWHEPGFALLDTEVEVALDLASRFDQHAVFELSADHLAVVWTDPEVPAIVQGWRSGAVAREPAPSG